MKLDLFRYLESVARGRQVCIYVVKALLIAIYLEGVDDYIPTLMPEAALPLGACSTEPVRTNE